MINTVIFDYGGVISEGGGKLPDLLEMMDMQDVLHDEQAMNSLRSAFRRLSEGHTTEAEIFETLGFQYSYQAPANWRDRWENFVREVMAPEQQMLELVQQVKEKGFHTVLLSNVFPLSVTAFRAMGVYDPFEKVYLSCETGVAKPKEKAFRMVVEDFSVSPSECLMIDDAERNIEAAKKLDMHAVLALDTSSTIAQIRSILELG